LLIIALILAAIEAVNFSFLLIKTVGFGEKNETISQSFKDFCLKNLLLCLFALSAAIIDSLISINFFKNFNLF
jgi:undecaprenyl pyrophosphate phosphatase UppP